MMAAIAEDEAVVKYANIWRELVNERANGELIINFLGGPEVIPAFDQSEAVRSGVVDIIYAITGYYESAVPEAATQALSRLSSPAEEREVGFYDLMVDFHKEKLNVYYLGRANFGAAGGGYFYTYLTKPSETPADLVGRQVRVSRTSAPVAAALGMTGVALPGSEVYTALEQGVIEGLITVTSSFYGRANHEIARYQIDHGYYQINDAILVNLDTWNSLPEHLQGIMSEAIIETEAGASAYTQVTEAEMFQDMIDNWGFTLIHYTPADAEWYVDTAYDAYWDVLAESIDATTLAQLREMLKS